jgi:glycosyltransferase involved in cell wall biosynthesis
MMRVVHAAIATPNRCGLYETTRELVAAERALGVNAWIYDPDPVEQYFPGGNDRGVPISRDSDLALEADIIISHSGHDNTPLQHSDQPVIHVAHGRPLSTFMGERGGKAPGLTYQTQRRHKDRFRAAVTFWPEYEPYLRNIWAPKPVHTLPPSVDLDYWRPGSSDYDFHGRRGGYNVVMLDPWSREDSSPYHCIHAFVLFRKIMPDARLHMLAWDGNKRGLGGLTNLLGDGGGMVTRWATNVREILHSADMVITPHRIYTRSIREAMACGLQVVSGRDCHPEDIEAFAMKMVSRRERPEPTRKMAEALFDPRNTGRSMLDLIEAYAGVPVGD